MTGRHSKRAKLVNSGASDPEWYSEENATGSAVEKQLTLADAATSALPLQQQLDVDEMLNPGADARAVLPFAEKLDDTSDDVITIMALPEDVMIEVFKWLSPSALLGPVPLVCKEWLRLSRLRAVWADCRVVYPTLEMLPFSSNEKREEARAKHGTFLRNVVKAPRVHALNVAPFAVDKLDCPRNPDFDGYDRVLPDEDDVDVDGKVREERVRHARITEAILRSLDSVTHLLLGDSFFIWPDRLFAVLSKFRDGLQGLSVQLRNEHVKYKREGISVLDVIAGMKKLRRLDLCATQLRPGLYDGVLGRGLPALERLGYRDPGCYLPNTTLMMRRVIGSEYLDGRDSEAVVLDLLGSHRDRLTRLDVDFVLPKVTFEVARAMSRCHKLRDLTVDTYNLVHVEAMPNLRTLRVHVDKYSYYKGRGSEMDDHDVADFIEGSEVLPMVEDLTLFRCVNISCGRFSSQRAVDGDPVSPVLEALARCCTAVRRLTLIGFFWSDADYAAVFAGFPALQVLDLSHQCLLRVRQLDALADSDRHLRLLNLDGVDFSSEEARTALQRIKERHPGTSVEETGLGCPHLSRSGWCWKHR